jgi:hypothetical protein
MLPQTTQSIGSRPYCAEQDSVRFSQRREPLRWKHLAELPGRQRRQLLCDRAKLQPQFGRRKLWSDVPEFQGSVLHAQRGRRLSMMSNQPSRRLFAPRTSCSHPLERFAPGGNFRGTVDNQIV